MPMKIALYSLIGIGAMLMVSSAFAHHSHAMFDQSRQVSLVGTVKQFEWDNPHRWIQLLVPNPNDPQVAPVEWSVEMNSPLALFRSGWKPESLKAGDKISEVVQLTRLLPCPMRRRRWGRGARDRSARGAAVPPNLSTDQGTYEKNGHDNWFLLHRLMGPFRSLTGSFHPTLEP